MHVHTGFGRRQGAVPFKAIVGVLGILVIGGLVVKTCRLSTSLSVQGYIEADYAWVASPAGGLLKTLAVQRGETLAPGALLFEMDRTLTSNTWLQVRAQLEEARASLQLARLSHDRTVRLFREHSVAQQDLDVASNTLIGAMSRVDALQAAERQARWQFDHQRQMAPGEARVHDTYYVPGEFVPDGRPVAALILPSHLKVRFFIPERDLSRIQAGQAVCVEAEGMPGVTGRVVFVSDRAEFTPPVIYSETSRDKLVFLVEAGFAPEVALRLHPGQPVTVRWQSP